MTLVMPPNSVRAFTQKVVMDADNDFATGFQCGYRQ